MINNIHQQEILLTFNSRFLSKIYFEKCNAASSDIFIELEKIEEACWNGLLEEVLPEIFTMDIYARPIFIWRIREYNSVMEIDMGEYPSDKENFFCIDPYKFMADRSNELNS
jgi:hypothetical protein